MCRGLPVQRNHQSDTTQSRLRGSPRHSHPQLVVAHLPLADIAGETSISQKTG